MRKWIEIIDDEKPKDGQWVLVAFDRDRVSIADYNAKENTFKVVQSIGYYDDVASHIYPTHWRKLPKHPKY